MEKRAIIERHVLESPYYDCATTALCALSPQEPLEAHILALHNNTFSLTDILAPLTHEFHRVGRVLTVTTLEEPDERPSRFFKSLVKSSGKQFRFDGGMFLTNEGDVNHVVAVIGYHPSNDTFTVSDTAPHARHMLLRRMKASEIDRRILTGSVSTAAMGLFSIAENELDSLEGVNGSTYHNIMVDRLAAQYHVYQLLHRSGNFYAADQI